MADPTDIHPGDMVTVDLALTDLEVIDHHGEPAIRVPTGVWLIRGSALTVVSHTKFWAPPEGWDSWEWLSITTPSRGALIFHQEEGPTQAWRQLRVRPEERTLWTKDDLLKVFGTGRWEEGEYRTKRHSLEVDKSARSAMEHLADLRYPTVNVGPGGGRGSSSGAVGTGSSPAEYGTHPPS